ncbi:MAG: NUDIX domain-containing protein [Deltaproteobacteria bacterium]|jgi:isopentenyldiphosphate isomerase|nr:NUDIX domain-containing protein [Deltaproteobacteria bacterium]MBW2536679.1 NUDIX domain-containing protein [Deltaproteobacteria bacterium]
MNDELFPWVDEHGRVLGSVPRSRAHGDPSRLHPVVHCIVTDRRGSLLLQLRGQHKDIQPGRWDTSVGGHVGYGESIESALRREIREEIGLAPEAAELRFLYRYLHRSPVESELVHTYTLCHGGPFRRQASEIDELRFWSPQEIESALGSGCFTPNFESEFRRFREATSPVSGLADGGPRG